MLLGIEPGRFRPSESRVRSVFRDPRRKAPDIQFRSVIPAGRLVVPNLHYRKSFSAFRATSPAGTVLASPARRASRRLCASRAHTRSASASERSSKLARSFSATSARSSMSRLRTVLRISDRSGTPASCSSFYSRLLPHRQHGFKVWWLGFAVHHRRFQLLKSGGAQVLFQLELGKSEP